MEIHIRAVPVLLGEDVHPPRGIIYARMQYEYGDMLIGKSSDGGVTFGMPTVLLRGTYRSGGKEYTAIPKIS